MTIIGILRLGIVNAQGEICLSICDFEMLRKFCIAIPHQLKFLHVGVIHSIMKISEILGQLECITIELKFVNNNEMLMMEKVQEVSLSPWELGMMNTWSFEELYFQWRCIHKRSVRSR